MISGVEQQHLIHLISESDGLSYGDPYMSASGIPSNFKIELAEAMSKSESLRSKIAGYIICELEEYDIDVIVATGGAVDLASNVASRMNRRTLVEIDSQKDRDTGEKCFFISDYNRDVLNSSNYAYVEDVSTTWGTVLRSIEQTEVKDPLVAACGWRRGVASELPYYSVSEYNKAAIYIPSLEYAMRFPVTGVIERPVPMYIRTEDHAVSWVLGEPIDS